MLKSHCCCNFSNLTFKLEGVLWLKKASRKKSFLSKTVWGGGVGVWPQFKYIWHFLFVCFFGNDLKHNHTIMSYQGLFLVFCEYMEDSINLKLFKNLWLYSSKKKQFWFLLMLKTSLAEVRKKNMLVNTNCWAPKTVVMVTNERYLLYLQLCGNAFMWIFMYFRWKSGLKLG